MSALPGTEGPMILPKSRSRLRVAAQLLLGYILAITSGSIVFATLLQLVPGSGASSTQQLSAAGHVEKIIELATLCFIMGGVFGVPYTVLGSLAFWFLLPRKAAIFFLIGVFCPMAAFVTMGFFLDSGLWGDIPFFLLTLPAGLIATYFYGAVGFGQGLGRWRFG